MVDLAKITKEDAKTAAIEFLGIFAMWTDCFFDGKAGARLLKLNEADYEGGDVLGDIAVLDETIAKSNLDDTVFVRQIEQIFEFAKWGTLTNALYFSIDGIHVSDMLTELGSFINMFGRRPGRKAGERHLPHLPYKDDGVNMLTVVNKYGDLYIDVLLTITDAAYARWRLIDGGHNLSIEEVALLAGVGIKTVRNAISSKGSDRLILKAGDKEIYAEEAYRWLITKKGFTGPFSYREEPAYQTYEIFGHFRHHCFVLRQLAKLDIADLTKALKWNASLTEAYISLENLNPIESLELLTPETLKALANFYQSKHINTFVVEGSKIIASVVAEIRAKALFI